MNLDIRVAGPGCRNCQELEARVIKALEDLQVEATVVKVTDFKDIAALGILTTPGLIINGKAVLQGKLPSVGIVKGLILEAMRS
ncbi:MAG: thioredoxin family protein [Acidobacteriota bacterium]